MRMPVGVVVDGRVTEMLLPASIPLAHLVPEMVACLCTDDRPREPRRADGEWLAAELSLLDQGLLPGGLVCLEERSSVEVLHHDPVAEIAERGPPVDLLSASPGVVVGGCAGVWIATMDPVGAVLATGMAPILWALLPMIGGLAMPDRVDRSRAGRARALLVEASSAAGAAALAASGVVATLGPIGIALDCCVGGMVLAHVGRARSRSAVLRVLLGAAEWWAVGAVPSLAVITMGWSGW